MSTRNLSPQVTKGIYAGPLPQFGNYLYTNYTGDLGAAQYEMTPAFTMGISNVDPDTLEPGSNLSAVESGASDVARDAGLDDTATGNSVGGTAAY
jgi:hypothetical protein